MAAASLFAASEVEAQYKSTQFGYEAGYRWISNRTGLSSSAPFIGTRVGYRLSDNLWLSSRIGFDFRDQLVGEPLTVFLLHLTPLDARWYFTTDRFRPFLGLTTAFQFFLNGPLASANWGPGALGGFEARIFPDVFLGIQLEYEHMVSRRPRYGTFGAVTQVNIFF
ncbi:MAG: hypothetical protein AAGD10_19700 [Myxococcota bacterium]